MKVFLGADHRGFALKQLLVTYLKAHGHEVVDCGPPTLDPQDDYPDYALTVAQAVAGEPESRGMLLCGSGMGMDVVANKVKGVRATVGYGADAIVHARSHDDINVLTLPADTLLPEEAEARAELFLMTPFGGEERNMRRLAKIAAIESENFK